MTKEAEVKQPVNEANMPVDVKMTMGILNYLIGLVEQRPIAEASAIHNLLRQQGQMALMQARAPVGNGKDVEEPKPKGRTRRAKNANDNEGAQEGANK